MKYWDEGKKEKRPVHSEFDISHIDQSVFDDPVLLLEYLEKQEKFRRDQRLPKTKALSESKYSGSSAPVNNGKYSVAIYGYDIIRGEIKINKDESRAVLAIFNYYDAGLTCYQIANELQWSIYRTSRGKKFYPAAVEMVVNNRIVYEGRTGYPPILSISEKGTELSKSAIKTAVVEKASNKPNTSKNENRITIIHNNSRTQRASNSAKLATDGADFKSADDFVDFIKWKGATIVDNRSKDGCLWVLSEPHIDKIIMNVQIKGRRLKLTTKSRAMGGKPAWYY